MFSPKAISRFLTCAWLVHIGGSAFLCVLGVSTYLPTYASLQFGIDTLEGGLDRCLCFCWRLVKLHLLLQLPGSNPLALLLT
jgi:hypothetical protein